ncbi:MAG TPA: peroxiredoxin [Casimicrobiaceae bacterium]
MLAATARAMATGMTNVAFSRTPVTPVVLAAGDPAPEFTLPASDGLTYRLSDFRGRIPVVIAWFPKAFTGGCTVECRSLDAYSSAFARSPVQCFAASVDTPATNAEFAGALGLTYPILSDEGKDVARAYGVLGPSGFTARWTFYIGADGRILDIDKQVRAASHGSDVAARLMELGIS